ncbi:MAG TPA: DUF4350 domain-containing protein [Candidatus Dormibacteraeota bacterium]
MRRARVLILLGVSLVLVVALALAAGRTGGTGGDTDPSSRSSGRAGTLALYSWLGDLGLDVHRISGDFDLSGSDVVVLVQPINSLSDADVQSLDSFLRGGGELIAALDGPGAVDAAAPLLGHLGLTVTGGIQGGRATPLGEVNPAVSVGGVDMGPTALDLGPGGGTALLALEQAVVMRAVSTGGGRAYVLGSAYALSNAGLRVSRPDSTGALQATGSDAYALVLAMLGQAQPLVGPPLRIGFDEFHHGEGAQGGWAQIFNGPLGLAALLAAAAILAFLAGGGRRLGRPIPAGDPTRVPSATTYVQAMAQLFARSAQRGAVADRFAQELKDRVGFAAGVDPHTDDAGFVAALSGFGAERRDQVGSTLWRARQMASGAPAEAELLALVREIDDVEAHWTAGAPA